MSNLFIKGIKHLWEKGPIITSIAVTIWIKNKLEVSYYKQTVYKDAEKVGSNLHVGGPTTVTTKTSLGNNVNFNGMRIYGGGKVIIGDNFHSGVDCMIITQNHNYDDGDAIPYDDTYIMKEVVIGDNVWLGSRVTILPGVTIEEGAIIQAGSTVTSDIPKGAIAGGHPATVFGKRDMEHYEQLKSEGKFN